MKSIKPIQIKVVYIIFFYIIYTSISLTFANDKICERKPIRTDAAALPPDDRFQLIVNGIIDNKYIPSQKYTVTLSSTDEVSTFIAFTISLIEDKVDNPKNIRKPIPLKAGNIYPNSNDAMNSESCNNTVINSDLTPKTSVKVTWWAPGENQGCVVIYAVVAVESTVWYDKEGPLLKKVCEDRRQKNDMLPPLNNNCQICGEARYELIFEGVWISNTHPIAFPKERELARFSDLVGASHNNQFELWKFNTEATVGLKMLAEQGNTTKLEMEIQEMYGIGVRTIIKAKGPSSNTKAYALFRVSRHHHRISLVTAILPSPDWFLGVANLELCEYDNVWANDITYNLYPLDAGTDSGKYFESPNDETSPPQPISSAVFVDKNHVEISKVKPFARLHLNLVRTYEDLYCTNDSNNNENPTTTEDYVSETYPKFETSSESTNPEPTETSECAFTDWEEWLACSGVCEEGKLVGYQSRSRYHLVDGVPVDMYTDDKPRRGNKKKVPEECINEDVVETQTCTCDCNDLTSECIDNNTETPSVSPGHSWNMF